MSILEIKHLRETMKGRISNNIRIYVEDYCSWKSSLFWNICLYCPNSSLLLVSMSCLYHHVSLTIGSTTWLALANRKLENINKERLERALYKWILIIASLSLHENMPELFCLRWELCEVEAEYFSCSSMS